MHTYINTYIHTHIPAGRANTYIQHTGSNTYILPYINTEGHTYMHIYIHTRTQMHTYIITYIHTYRLTD